MKRYIVFAGDALNPAGGAADIQALFGTHREVKEYVADVAVPYFGWFSVYDVKEEKTLTEEEIRA